MMTTITTKVGPKDDGRRMSLGDFDQAKAEPGHLYELSRGVVVVSDVPRPAHARVISRVRRMIERRQDAHPDEIYDIYGSNECKMLIEEFESERHTDLSVYVTPPPTQDASVWSMWIPALVLE